MTKILNVEIEVQKYKIGPSIYTGVRLDMQILIRGELRIAWTSSKYMIDQIEKVEKDKFPFTTTIIEKDDGSYIFT